LGVIGISEGNGHPYSWAAICNGYSPENMKDCEFPVICQYLGEQSWPDARISGVEVTHIWTQSVELSQRISKASLISNAVHHPNDMLGKIDALLLARDDAENHFKFAAPFIKAGIPIYIDKPIALSLIDLELLYQLQQYDGQIFTCSALRFANEFILTEGVRERIGHIRHIHATTPNSWEKYAVHIIEPVLKMIDSPVSLKNAQSRLIARSGRAIAVDFENGVTAEFLAFGKDTASPLAIRVYGESGWHDMVLIDSFSAFKTALIEFIVGIQSHSCRSPLEFNRQVVSILEFGLCK